MYIYMFIFIHICEHTMSCSNWNTHIHLLKCYFFMETIQTLFALSIITLMWNSPLDLFILTKS